MKKRMKGLISWWLVFAVLFSSVTVSFATETAEIQSTIAEYYKGSNSLDSSYTVEYGETTDLSLYYGDEAETLTEQVSSLEKANRPENKILLGWKLWGMHYYGELDAGPIEKSLTDVVTAEDVTTCLNNNDNYYNPLIEPHYVDKYIIDPQPTNETFTVGGKVYDLDRENYVEADNVSYQWYGISAEAYTVVGSGNSGDWLIEGDIAAGDCSDDGVWSSDTEIVMFFPTEAGDVIKVTPITSDSSSGSNATVVGYDGAEHNYTLTDGAYCHEAETAASDYGLMIADFAEGDTFKIEVIRYGDASLLSGQDKATLNTDGIADGLYFCRLTFDESGENIVLESEKVEFAYTAPAHEHPICGDAECASHGDDVTFEPWTATDSLPTSGNYYLTSDVTLSAIYEPSGTVNLCLNGYKISSTRNSNVVYVDSGKTLNICDCIGNGKITSDHSAATINVKGTASLHSGTVENKNSNGYPGISLDSGSLTVTGGTVTSSKISSDGIGIGVYAGTLTLSGAPTISGTAADINLKGNGNAVITVDGSLSNTTPYKVRLTYYDELPYTIVTANATDYSDRFEAVNSNYGLYYDTTSQCVKLAKVENIPVIHRHPICGDTECTSHGSGVTYTAWDGTTDFPGGNVYLSNDITLEETLEISSGTVNLCLNGKVLRIRENAIIGAVIEVSEGATLNICDCRTTEHKFSPDESGLWVLDEENGTKSVSGGVITGGNTTIGSAIYSSGTLRIYGGNIVGNHATSRAVVYSTGAEFSMYGGSICGNTGAEGNYGVGLCLRNSTGKHQIRGGKIYENKTVAYDSPEGVGVYVSQGNLTIYGAVEIYGNKRGTENDNIYVPWNRSSQNEYSLIIDGELTNTTPIGVWARYEDIIIKADGTNVTDLTEYMDHFTPDNTGRELQLSFDKKNIKLLSPHKHPICGAETCTADHNLDGTAENHQSVTWIAWDGTDMDEGEAGIQLNAGNYYLTKDVIVTSDTGGIHPVDNVALCLNGHTISCESGAAVTAAISFDNKDDCLTLTDCAGTGLVTRPADDYSITIWISSGKLEQYGGTIQATSADNQSTAIWNQNNGTFSQYSGKIESESIGIHSLNESTVNLYGGTIEAAIADIYVQNEGAITLSSEISRPAEPYSIVADFNTPFTSGWNTYMSSATISDYFIPYSSEYIIKKNASTGELVFDVKPTTYTVKFDANGGTCETASAETIDGKLATLPDATRVGYIFNGWFDASEGGNKITTETEFTDDTRIYAQWTAYEITQQPTVDNEYEVKVNPSANVAYTWHEITETAVTTDNADIYEDEGYSSSYTAEWWSCHSTEGMGTPGYFSIDLNAGDMVEVELSRACTGTVRIQHYYDDGANVTRYQAYKDTGGGNKASLVAPAAANYELFVSVHDDGEQPTLKAKVIKAGEAISGQTSNKLTDGTDGTNYVAKITYPDSAVLTSDAVCYVSPSFEVTFDTNGGTNVSKQTVDNGGKVEEPATPTKTGYTFAGWYKDSELETAWDFDTDTVTEPTTLYAKWTAKAEVIINTDVQNYTYDKSAKQFEIKGTSLTGFTVSYKQGETPVINPTNAGTYDVIITRPEDDSYKSYSKTITEGLVINKAVVNVPTVASKVYTGENQTADIPESELYTETSNEGRTTVGTANVVLTLVDSANYKWSDGTETATKTIEFEITKANVNAITGLDIEGWTYGENAKSPTASATFGTPNFTYVGTGETNYAESTTPPSNVGTYKVIAKVADTANFVGASDEKEFAIAKATPTYTAPVNLKATYGDTLADVTLPDGWSWKDSSLSVGNAGTNEFTAVFTPQDTTNFEVVEINVSVAVGKTIPSYDIPVDIEATYGDTLADVTLPDGWSWKDAETSVGNAGEQTFAAIFTPSDSANYKTVEKDVTITVAKKEVTEPVASGSYTYTGDEQTVILIGVESFMTVSGNKATNAGNYVVTVTLDNNHRWNSTSDGEIAWSIAKADMSADITASGYNGVFDNQAHTISVAIPDGASIKYGTDDGTYELVAAPQYTNVGTYKVYYKVEKANYNAVTGSADVVITAKDISNAEITLGEALTYTDSEQTRDFTVAPLDGLEIDYSVSGNVGTDAGVYTLTISGQGNFTGSKSVSWSIGKASQPAPETPAAVNETIKAKADGKITGVNSDMEYKPEGASEYIAISETEIADLAAGTYLVRYKEDANHFAGTDKQVVIENGAMITASFNSNEGTAVDSITCEYNQAITAPAEPTKENFVFAGWYKDAECLDLWNFGNALTEDITLYAKWNDKPVYSVSGKVTDGESGLGGITVTLKQGNTIIATTTTAADGSYSFITEDGLYNIVAEKEENDNSTIKTVKIEVIESANVNDVVFVATDINSELEIKPDTPQIIVGGLDEEAQTVSSSNGNADVTVKMTVESTEDITGSDDATGQEQRQTEQKEIKKVSGNRYIQFIEINLTQSISGAESTKLEETSGLIEIIIPFEKGNKRNITVYRYHGSASEKLGAGIGNANADGEYFEVKENHIVVYAKKFSTYAIGYDLPSSGGGGSSVTRYTVKFDTNGGSSVSSATVTKNAKVAEPKTPEKDGYTFGGWYTDKEFAEKYDFESKVTKNLTLYAKWDKHDDEQSITDTHNCPSLAFDDLDITKWYHFDTDYAIENGIFKGTTETTFEPDSAQTRAMMVTVLYRVEGEPAVNRSIPFADVDMGAYYANAVIWGQQNGIIKGYSETEFGPDDKITREQIAAIMHRYAQYKGIDVSIGENTNILSYDDFDSISEYAIASMQWAVGSGLIKGKSESTLNPLDNATRAEIAAILHRFIEAKRNA